MFSSIETNKRAEVIQQCYWPLLQMAEDGFVVSLEATALTLEIINDIDPSWITQLRKLIEDGKIEFIGSGYSQIIAPIVPELVNLKNLQIGADVYDQLIGFRPTVYLINEMAFSVDLISLYRKAGIEHIIFEWNNFYKYSKGIRKEYSNTPIQLSDGTASINVVWADSVIFQKFQRCVHGEVDQSDLIDYIRKTGVQLEIQFVPIYTSDAEIFDFRPGRYKTENNQQVNEWEKVRSLYSSLGEKAEFIFIRDMLSDTSYTKPVIEFKPKFPIQVKKQEKYNVFRWAIGGRDNLCLNADCYRIYEHFINTGAPNEDAWKALLLYWSSDFRTHITIPRFNEIKAAFSAALLQIESVKQGEIVSQQKAPSYTTTEQLIQIESESYIIRLNRKKGLVIDSFQPLHEGCRPVIGQIAHGTYDDITYRNDYMAGYAICYDSARKQHTHLFDRRETIRLLDDRIIIEAENNCNDKFVIHDIMTATAHDFEIDRSIHILDETVDIIHPFIFTFLPENELRNMTYDVCCGSGSPVNYPLSNWSLVHQQSKYLTISAIHGISPTDGKLVMRDSSNLPQLHFAIDNTCSPLVCNFQYEGNVGLGDERLPFCWLVMSAQEINDVYKETGERSKTIHCKVKLY
jgi:hypothetical protein